MEISGNIGGVALYAMQQSTKMPGAVVDLLQKSAEGCRGAAAPTGPSEPKESEVAKMTGKGININTVA